MDSFVHLKLHTEYSLVDGIVKIPDGLARAKALGMTAMAMTDHMNLFGLVKFYKKAVANGIKPIFGADLVLREGSTLSEFTLLCMNDEGYRNLTALVSRAYTEGYYQDRPTVLWSWVAERAEGLIALSGGARGNIANALFKNDNVESVVACWQRAFPDRFYVSLVRTEREKEDDYLHRAVQLAAQYDLPVVATNDVRFMAADDFTAHEARVCIHDGYTLEDPRRPKNYSPAQYLKSPDEMIECFADIPEAIANTVEIAKRCNVKLRLGESFLPQFPIPVGMTTESFLAQESELGLNKLLEKHGLRGGDKKDYSERLKVELDVINSMGFPGYFLIVADFIRWAKENGIPVGPGRGSGAGSLVAYALGITELDPLEHELLFERFLNPERVSMPDFDVDFCMERRDEVIAYVAEHYGREAVSQIITYGTMAAKAVVRDVGRVLGMPYGFVDKLAKLIPFEIGMTLNKALAEEPQLEERYNEEEEVRTLIDLALKLEGMARNAGKHAGGVLIAPGKITDFCAIYCESGSTTPVSQFDKDDVEAVGLVKFDFLGLRTLTIIDWALQAINKRLTREGAEPVDITSIDLACEKTFDLLKACETSAVFQLESRGMKDLIRRLQPGSFDDITALVALFRPGPLQSGMVDDFIERKHGRAHVEYPHPDVETILKPTYGVILYQEQVMQIAQVLANYTLGGADILRRAMGKKKPEEMAKQRTIFLEGSGKRGIDAKIANYIFDLMEKFAGYGFNKSHSAAYALIAYQTAWLKAHYPAEFMAAVLSSDMDNTDKVVGFLTECGRMGLKVNLPNINVDNLHFTVNEVGQINYGVGAIKGVGEAAIEQLLEERVANGPYEDLFDLCERLDTRKLNRRVLEALIKSGALDEIGPHRAAMLGSVNKALKLADQSAKNAAMGQNDMFGAAEAEDDQRVAYCDADRWLPFERLQGEKETLGQYVSGHPISIVEEEISHFTTTKLGGLGQHMQQLVTIAGMVTSVRALTTKSGRRMAIVGLEDRTGTIDVTLFAAVFEESRELLEKDRILVVKGTVEADDFSGGLRMRCETIIDLNQVRNRLAKHLMLSFEDSQSISELLSELSMALKGAVGGRVPVVFSYENNDANTLLRFGDSWKVRLDDPLMNQLAHICGEQVVKVEY